MLLLTESAEDFDRVNRLMEPIRPLAAHGVRLQLEAERELGIGTELCIIESGSLSVRVQGHRILVLETGDCFFRDAFEDHPVVSDFKTLVSLLSENLLTEHLSKNSESFLRLTHLLKESNRAFSRLFISSQKLSNAFDPEVKSFLPGEVILREGEQTSDILSLVEGRADVSIQGVHVGEIQEDEIFGATAAVTDTPRTATITAKTDCLVMSIPKENFMDLMQAKPSATLKLLKSMARSIIELNKQVVEHARAHSA